MRKPSGRRVSSDASVSDIAKYLPRYIEVYRSEYKKLIATPPIGAGLPEAPLSPYLERRRFEVLVARNGVVVYVCDQPPAHEWWLAGGPAVKADYEPTLTPEWVNELLLSKGLKGRSIGIFRVVSQEKLPEEVWNGVIPEPVKVKELSDGSELRIAKLNCKIEDAIARLTFGAFGRVIDIHLDRNISDFWRPNIISGFGFLNGDFTGRIFYNYIEVLPHIDKAAWDIRSIALRAASDVRRDFARIAGREETGGTLSFGEHSQWVESYQRSLDKLAQAIDGFEKLLKNSESELEERFHSFLEENPILLDPIGRVVSKPRFTYPSGKASPDGKKYLEPDFVIVSPTGSCRLIEIERPSKKIATKAGHARQDLAQAVFQIAEWKHFIARNYEAISDRFPNISENSQSVVILSLDSLNNFKEDNDLREKIEQLKRQFNIDEIWTYDDVLRNARSLYDRLSNLGL